MSSSRKIIKAGAINVVPLGERGPVSFIRTDYRQNNSRLRTNRESAQQSVEEQAVAREEADRQRSEDAFKKGLNEGMKRGSEEAKKALAPALATLEKAALKISELKDSLWRQSEESMVDLAFTIAEKIIRREVSFDRTIVRELLEEILSDFKNSEDVLVRLNPMDYKALKSEIPDCLGDNTQRVNLRIEEDRRIEPGGAVIETPSLVIDGRIEEQLLSLRDSIALYCGRGDR